MQFRCLVGLILITFVALPSVATAEKPSVATDRPSFGSSAYTIPEAMVQVEGGADVAIDDDTTLTLPVLFFRIGVNEVLELQLGAPSVTFAEDEDSLGATRIATKYAGSVADDLSLGLLTAIDLPKSDDGVFGQAAFSATALADYALTDILGLSLNVGLAVVERDEPSEASRQLQQIASLAIGVSLPANLGTYAEVYQIYQPSFDGIAVGADAGLTWLAARWLQFDLYGNFGFSDELADVIVGAGFGLLVP